MLLLDLNISGTDRYVSQSPSEFYLARSIDGEKGQRIRRKWAWIERVNSNRTERNYDECWIINEIRWSRSSFLRDNLSYYRDHSYFVTRLFSENANWQNILNFLCCNAAGGLISSVRVGQLLKFVNSLVESVKSYPCYKARQVHPEFHSLA